MVSTEILSSIIEVQHLVSILGAIPIVFLITKQQAQAIYKRDLNSCQYPGIHKCNNKKLTIHHVQGKEDVPENLLTVCKHSHLDIIHGKSNGYCPEYLELIAIDNTQRAKKKGWEFPDK